MIVDRISTMTPVPSLPTPNSDSQQKNSDNQTGTSGGAANNSNDKVQLQITIPRQTLDTLQKIGSVTDVLNDTAKSLRSTANGLSASADIAAKMRSTLEKIVKNYPPFPIDSAERKDILMSYRALQKEMEKMMVPAPPQPLYEKVKSLWNDLFGQSRSGSVATPNLPEKAPDSAVADATQHLAATSDAITTIHSAIGASL